MGIKLNWDDQTDQNLDAVEIYRTTTPFDPNNPGTPLATLPGDATSYEDNTVSVGNTYYYTVAVKKGEDRSFAATQTQGYYSNLGPGPKTILRGDWTCGYFGEIPNEKWVTPVDVVDKIKSVLAVLTGLNFNTSSTTWHKFVYNGKIFYTPNNQLIYSTWQNAYNAGFLFGEDGFGELPTGVAGNVNQKRIIEIDGQYYLVRPMRMTNKPTTQYLTTQEDFYDGEWKATFARLRKDAKAITDPMIRPRFNDYDSLVYCGGPHLAAASAVATANSANIESIASTALTANVNWMIVLELIP